MFTKKADWPSWTTMMIHKMEKDKPSYGYICFCFKNLEQANLYIELMKPYERKDFTIIEFKDGMVAVNIIFKFRVDRRGLLSLMGKKITTMNERGLKILNGQLFPAYPNSEYSNCCPILTASGGDSLPHLHVPSGFFVGEVYTF